MPAKFHSSFFPLIFNDKWRSLQNHFTTIFLKDLNYLQIEEIIIFRKFYFKLINRSRIILRNIIIEKSLTALLFDDEFNIAYQLRYIKKR